MKPTDALIHPVDWQTTTVGKSIEVKRGISWSAYQEHPVPREGAIPVIRIGNVQERLNTDDLIYISGLKPKSIETKRVSAGWSVIVGSNGNRNRVGNAVLVKEDTDYLFASFLMAARPRDDSGIIPEFFYRWLSDERTQTYLSASSEGTTGLNNLSHSFFKSMTIAFPSCEEQTAIARILDGIDAAIEREHTAVALVRGLKTALLQKFFYGALGQTAYADRPTKDLPVEWALVPTESLLESEPKNGVSPKAVSQPPGVPTFSIAAIRHGKVDLENSDNLKYTRVSEKVAQVFGLKHGDVLIVRGNANPDLVGKAAIVDCFPDRCIYPDITKRVVFRRAGAPNVTPQFAVLAWNHSIVHNQVLRRAKTSNGTLKINNRDVKQIVMPVPPSQEQSRIVNLATALECEIDARSRVTEAYRQLKRSVLHDLLTGKVRADRFKLKQVA